MSSNSAKIVIGATGSAAGYVGDDLNNKGFFATGTALAAAFPTGVDGWYAVVGATDSIWVWDEGTSAWIDSGNKFVAGGMLVETYDPQSIAADCFDVDNHTDGSTNKVFTAIEKAKLSGIEAGAQVNVAPTWTALPDKPTIPTSTANLPDSLNKRYVTDAQLGQLSSLNSIKAKNAEAANGTDGQVITFTTAMSSTAFVVVITDPNGLGIQVVSQTVNGFTINSLTAGNFGYVAIKEN